MLESKLFSTPRRWTTGMKCKSKRRISNMQGVIDDHVVCIPKSAKRVLCWMVESNMSPMHNQSTNFFTFHFETRRWRGRFTSNLQGKNRRSTSLTTPVHNHASPHSPHHWWATLHPSRTWKTLPNSKTRRIYRIQSIIAASGSIAF